MTYLLLKYLHILGAIILLGTGIGIAFFMLMAHRTGDADHIARTTTTVVLADFIFTATAVVAQPVTGFLLAQQTGLPLTEGWVLISLLLYVLAGVFWLPVIGLQMRMRDLAQAAALNGRPLPDVYFRLFRIWFVFGCPGFGAVIVILWLMVVKPSF
jgi:uncharacterized membrane protein